MIKCNPYSACAALAIMGFSVAHVAKEIDVSEARLEAELYHGGVLTPAEYAKLWGFCWRYRIVPVSGWLFEGALVVRPLDTLKAWCTYAERQPQSRNDGWAFWLFARAWRFWLRATGQGHRILRPANDVRPMDDGAAE